MSFLIDPYRYTAEPITDCTGYTDSSDTPGGGLIRCCKVTASSDYSVAALGLNSITASDNVQLKMALYSDNSDVPDVLLGQTAYQYNVTGIHYYDLLSDVSVTNGTSYWVALIHLPDTGTFEIKGESTAISTAQTYAAECVGQTFCSPFGTPLGSATFGFQFCMNNGIT